MFVGADSKNAPRYAYGDDRDEDNLREILENSVSALRRRKSTVVQVFILIFCFAVIAALLMTPKYDATATIKMEPSGNILNGGNSGDSQNGEIRDWAVFNTEMSVVRSQQVADKVVQQLQLDRDRRYIANFRSDGTRNAQRNLRQLVASRLLDNFTVTRRRDTNLIELVFRSEQPEEAARVANSFAYNYIEYANAQRRGVAERRVALLVPRLTRLRQQLQESYQTLTMFRASNAMVAPGHQTIVEQQAAQISQQLAVAQSTAKAVRTQLIAAEERANDRHTVEVSAVLNSLIMQQLRANRAATRQLQSQLATRYGPRHPETLRADEQLASIDSQIRDEAARILAEMRAEEESANSVVDSLSRSLMQLRMEQASGGVLKGREETLLRNAMVKRDSYIRLSQVVTDLTQTANTQLLMAQVISPAVSPSVTAFPSRTFVIVGGAAAALDAGLIMVLILELFSTGLASAEEVEAALGLRLLSSIPELQDRNTRSRDLSPSEEVIRNPLSPYAESFRNLRRSLTNRDGSAPKVVVVVSAYPDEGKTTSALSFARVLALSGERTLVVDCDIRKAGLSSLAGNELHDGGLLEVLRGNVNIEAAITPDIVTGLDLLLVKQKTFDASDFFGNDALLCMLNTITARYDRVVIDTPPVLGLTDARLLAEQADAVVLIIKRNTTPLSAVRTALSLLVRHKVPLAGAVITMADANSDTSNVAYYYSGYASS